MSHSTSGGTRTRVLEVLGKPLGDQNGELVIRLRRGITDHYGHAGPRLVCWLQEQHAAGRWPELKQWYRDLVDEYMRGLEEREGVRLAEYIALVAVTVELAHEALDLPWPWTARSKRYRPSGTVRAGWTLARTEPPCKRFIRRVPCPGPSFPPWPPIHFLPLRYMSWSLKAARATFQML